MKRNSNIKSEHGDQTGDRTVSEATLDTRPVKYAILRPKPLPPPPPPPPPPLPPLYVKKPLGTLLRLDTKIGSLRRCRVKLCPLKDCHLRSHRFYSVQTGSIKKTISNLKANGQNQKNSPVPRAFQHCQDTRTPSLIRGGVDGLPVLPLDGFDLPVFQQLFHKYFSYTYDRASRLLLIPPLTPTTRIVAAERKSAALAVSLSAPIFCIHAIAAAHHQLVFQSAYRRPDRTTIVIHSKIMTLLRTKLDHFDQSELTELVSVVMTLVMFEIAAGRFESLTVHHRAVRHIVATQGDLHNIKTSGATTMILNLDRLLSILTCQPPLYTPPRDHLIRKPAVAPCQYGMYFDNSSSLLILGQDINQYCQDACRAIEILESEGWTFQPEDPPFSHSPNLHYFFFLRDCVANEFVRLNVLTANDKTLARCVLVATKIVEYTALMDNYLVTLSIELANRLQALICQDAKHIMWESQQGVLCWVLFVLTSMPSPWDDRPWALNLLRTQLEQKYHGKVWPVDWRRCEHENICQFVWSNTRFQSTFATTCNELQHDFIHPARVLPMD